MSKHGIASVLLVAMAAASIASGADGVVGWRGDGTGRYPQAKPTLNWSADANVIWKTPMKNWSNAIPTIVGGRLFTCVEPGTLVCVNVGDGKILWEKTLTYEDVFSKDELDETKKQMAALMVEMKPIDAEIQKLQDEIARQTAPILAPVKGLDGQVRKLRSRIKGDDLDAESKKKIDIEMKKLRAEIQKLRVEANKLAPDVREKVRELSKVWRLLDKKRRSLDILAIPSTHAVTGYSTPTPVSDGKHVYVLTATGIAACYDMDGKRIWARFIEKPTRDWGHSASPVLVGDKLIVHVLDPIALDVKNGNVLWRAKSKANWGSPIAISIGGQDVLVTTGGEVISVEDGTVIAKRISSLEYCAPVVSDGVVYFIQNGGKAVKLPDAVSPGAKFAALWTTKPKNDRYYASPIVHEGLIYAITRGRVFSIIDAADGSVVVEKKLNLGGSIYPSIVLGGKHLFVSSDNGTTVVLEPGREYKEVARNTLEPFRSTPVFVGNRMYVRGLKNLYCIGVK